MQGLWIQNGKFKIRKRMIKSKITVLLIWSKQQKPILVIYRIKVHLNKINKV